MEAPVTFKRYLQDIQTPLGQILMAFFRKHYKTQAQADAKLSNEFKAYGAAYKDFTDIRFLMRVVAANWAAFAPSYGVDPISSQPRIKNVLQLLHAGAHETADAGKWTWNDIDGMRSDLEAFLTWLSRPNPINGDLALPAALTLKEQVNKNWQKLDTTSTTGPFSSPSILIEPVTSGANSAGIELHIDNLIDVSKEDLHEFFLSACSFEPKSITSASTPIPGGSAFSVVFSSASEMQLGKNEITSVWPDAIISQVNGGDSASGFITYDLQCTVDAQKKLETVLKIRKLAVKSISFDEGLNETVVLFEKDSKAPPTITIAGQAISCLPFTPYRLKLSALPPDATKESILEMLNGVTTDPNILFIHNVPSLRLAVIHADSNTYNDLVAVGKISMGSATVPVAGVQSRSPTPMASGAPPAQPSQSSAPQLSGEATPVLITGLKKVQFIEFAKALSHKLGGGHVHLNPLGHESWIRLPQSQARIVLDPMFSLPAFPAVSFSATPVDMLVFSTVTHKRFAQVYLSEKLKELESKHSVRLIDRDASSSVLHIRSQAEDASQEASAPLETLNAVQKAFSRFVEENPTLTRAAQRQSLDGITQRHAPLLCREALDLLESSLAPIKCAVTLMSTQSAKVPGTVFATFYYLCDAAPANANALFASLKADSKEFHLQERQAEAIAMIDLASFVASHGVRFEFQERSSKLTAYGFHENSLTRAFTALQEQLNKFSSVESLRADHPAKVFFLYRHRADVDAAIAKVDANLLADVTIFYRLNDGAISLSGPGESVKKVKQIVMDELKCISSASVGKSLLASLWAKLGSHPELLQKFAEISSVDASVLLYCPASSKDEKKPKQQSQNSPARGRGRGGSPAVRGRGGQSSPAERKPKEKKLSFCIPTVVSRSPSALGAARDWLAAWVADIDKPTQIDFSFLPEIGIVKSLIFGMRKANKAAGKPQGKPVKLRTSSSSSNETESDDSSSCSSDDDSENDSQSDTGSDASDAPDADFSVAKLSERLKEIPVLVVLKKADKGASVLVSGHSEDVVEFVEQLRLSVGALLRVHEPLTFAKDQKNKELIIDYLRRFCEDDLRQIKTDLHLQDIKFMNSKLDKKKQNNNGNKENFSQRAVIISGRRNDVDEAKRRILAIIKQIRFVAVAVGPADLPKIGYVKSQLIETSEEHCLVYKVPFISTDINAKESSQAIRLAGRDEENLKIVADWIGSVQVIKKVIQRPEIDQNTLNIIKAALATGQLKQQIHDCGVKVSLPLYPPRIELQGCGDGLEEVVEAIESLISKERALREIELNQIEKRIVLSGKRFQFLSGIAAKHNCKLFQHNDAEKSSGLTLRIAGKAQEAASCVTSIDAQLNAWRRGITNQTIQLVPKGLSLQALNLSSKLDKLATKTGCTIAGKPSAAVLSSFDVGQNKSIDVVVGSIVRQRVDAIVNAANGALDHMGGVARVIADSAGARLTQECAAIVSQRQGKIPTGAAVTTKAFELKNCKYIIHAVGPIWTGASPAAIATEEAQLRDAVVNSILEAAKLGISSIAFPAISTGIFGFPLAKAVKIITGALVDMLESSKSGSVSSVRIVDIKFDTARAFAAELGDRFGSPADISQMSQTIHMGPVTKIDYVWYWRENDNSFKPFDPDQNLQIEKAFLAGHKSVEVTGDLNQVQNGHRYLVDLVEKWEMNLTYKANKRPIERRQIKPEQRKEYDASSNVASPLPSYASSSSPAKPKAQKNAAKDEDDEAVPDHSVRVVGIAEDVLSFTAQAKTLVENLIAERNIEAGALGEQIFSPEKRSRIQAICSAHATLVEFSTDFKQARIRGEKSVLTAVELEMLSKLKGSHLSFPDYWSPQKNNLEVFDVPANSLEFQQVLQRLRETLPNAQLHRLQRIQNRIMWKSYVSKRETLLEKNAVASQEPYVFHGTRQTNPADIYSSPEGFNLGFASQGMWGTGLYFAKNSAYSGQGYHHQDPATNHRQMFLVRLLLGEVIDMPSDPKLRVPPEIKNPSGHLGLKVNRYDTVSGETGGSRVFIVYDNNRAYPEYLLSFTI